MADLEAIKNQVTESLKSLEGQLWKELVQVSKDQDSSRVDKVSAAIKKTKSLIAAALEVFESLAESTSSSRPSSPEPFISRGVNATVLKRRTLLPKEVRIGEEVKSVRYLNEVPIVVGNWILDQGKSLPEMSNFIHRSDKGFAASAQTKRLKNGWWIEVGDDRRTLLSKARKLLDQVGFSSTPFRVVLVNGDVLEG